MEYPTKYYSDRQEKAVAKYMGWSQVSGSGSRPCVPGDVISDDWLGECKTKTSPGQAIHFDTKVWSKIQQEANSCFHRPVLIVDDGSQEIAHTWCLYLAPLQISLVATEAKAYPLPEAYVSKNINFKEADLAAHYETIIPGKVRPVFYTVLDRRLCAVSTLETLKHLIDNYVF